MSLYYELCISLKVSYWKCSPVPVGAVLKEFELHFTFSQLPFCSVFY